MLVLRVLAGRRYLPGRDLPAVTAGKQQKQGMPSSRKFVPDHRVNCAENKLARFKGSAAGKEQRVQLPHNSLLQGTDTST